MKNENSKFLIFGLVVGGILSAGFIIYLSSKFISKTNRNMKERKHKFFEGMDDIFDASTNSVKGDDNRIDKETEDGIIKELFSRNG